MPLIASLLLGLGSGALHFLGDEGCPQAGAVEAQLRRIDPTAMNTAASQLVLIEIHPGGLRVRLFDGQGTILEDRLLEGSRSCADWAKATAALLATWESQIGAPDLYLTNVSPPEPGPEPARVDSQVKSKRGATWDGEVGIGPSFAIAGDGSAAVGGEVLLGFSPHAAGWGLELGASTVTERSLSVIVGTANWERYLLSLGAYITFGNGPLRLDLGAAFLGALISANGSGLSQNATSSSFDVGFDGRVRLKWDFGSHVRLWAQAGPLVWPKTEHVQVIIEGHPATGTIPLLDLLATLGISFTFGL